MNPTVFYILIGILAFLVLGLMIVLFMTLEKGKKLQKNHLEEKNQWNEKFTLLEAKSKAESLKTEQNFQRIISENELKLEKERVDNKSLSISLTKTETEKNNLLEKLNLLQNDALNREEKMKTEFENLANKILERNSEKMTSQNKQNIEGVLNPLKEKLQEFEHKVELTHRDNIEKNASLKQQIEDLSKLNQQITKEAHNLTKALKGDNKMQGNWGELVLERVLEKSGLDKGEDYFTQNNFTTQDGKRVIPDVIINLPEGKKMIVDSKVSLISYERYVNEEEEDLKEALLKTHVQSIKNHVEDLSSKKYEQLLEESPDFVLLFIPIEPAFALATSFDNNLYNKAFEKNIIIVTPTTLLATLRTVDSMWKYEKQQKNAQIIAQKAGQLYDKFVNLLDDFEKVGKQLGTVQNSYQNAMTKLTGNGNLIRRTEELKKLGVKSSKQISQKWIEKENL